MYVCMYKWDIYTGTQRSQILPSIVTVHVWTDDGKGGRIYGDGRPSRFVAARHSIPPHLFHCATAQHRLESAQGIAGTARRARYNVVCVAPRSHPQAVDLETRKVRLDCQ